MVREEERFDAVDFRIGHTADVRGMLKWVWTSNSTDAAVHCLTSPNKLP